MRGDAGRWEEEDPYAEKERLQQKFIRGNPEDELSQIIAGKSTEIVRLGDRRVSAAGKSTEIVRLGDRETTCPGGP